LFYLWILALARGIFFIKGVPIIFIFVLSKNATYILSHFLFMIDAERKGIENGTVLLFKGIPDDEETMSVIVDTKKTRHLHLLFQKPQEAYLQ